MREKGKRYDEQFRRDAVDHQIRTGKSLRQAAKDLGVSEQSLRSWKEKYLAEPDGPQQQTMIERIDALEKENAELREEREILKKSVAIFLKPRK